MADPSDIQRKYKEFLDLLPLTLSLAGLPPSEHGITSPLSKLNPGCSQFATRGKPPATSLANAFSQVLLRRPHRLKSVEAGC